MRISARADLLGQGTLEARRGATQERGKRRRKSKQERFHPFRNHLSAESNEACSQASEKLLLASSFTPPLPDEKKKINRV